MPLYACDGCGLTSTAFRADGAIAHRLEHPDCAGTIRIIFRADDRSRAPAGVSMPGPWSGKRTLPPSFAARAASSALSARVIAAPRDGLLEIRERVHPDGCVQLMLVGELERAAATGVRERLGQLKASRQPVRLDLSQLAFIDSSGVQALLLAVAEARADGWPLEIAWELSADVQALARIIGLAQILWPEPGRPG